MNTAQGDRDVHAQSVIFRRKVNPLNLWCRQVESQRKVKKHQNGEGVTVRRSCRLFPVQKNQPRESGSGWVGAGQA